MTISPLVGHADIFVDTCLMIIRRTVYHHGRNLRHDQLTFSKEACPVCEATGLCRELAVILHSPTVDIFLCGLRASHMSLPEVLLHDCREYYKPGDQPKVTMGSVSRLATHISGALLTTMAIKPYELKILDIGGGDGGIEAAVARLFGGRARVTVIDPSTETVIGDGTTSIEHRTSLEDAGGVFDLGIASAVAERVPAARNFLTQLLPRIRPGRVFIPVPPLWHRFSHFCHGSTSHFRHTITPRDLLSGPTHQAYSTRGYVFATSGHHLWRPAVERIPHAPLLHTDSNFKADSRPFSVGGRHHSCGHISVAGNSSWNGRATTMVSRAITVQRFQCTTLHCP